ncbi:MAG: DUF1484 family protein [Rubrivivax sp.]|nr:MAG: DUF1484 family protein [Rubrivivax sp.]
MEVKGTRRRLVRPIGELSDTVNEVDSSLEAICELLQHANGAKVNACGIHALLRPLQRKLSSAASALSDLPT